MIKQFAKLLIVASTLSFAAMPMSYAGEKAAKQPSCKEQAKQAGIKDKNEKKKFVKECEEKKKAGAEKKCGGK